MAKYVRILPYLTRSEIAERDRLENALHRDLSSCRHSYETDEERAEHILHAAVVAIYDVEYLAYCTKPGYESKWVEHIVQESVYRVLKAAENIYWSDLPALFKELTKTLDHHIRRIPGSPSQQEFTPTTQQIAAYAKAGVDLSSASPLLIMAAMGADTGSASKPAVAKRVPRSINSIGAAEKMDKYREKIGLDQTQFAGKLNVDPKTLYKFRRTGRLDKRIAAIIAAEMGTTVEELLKP